MIINPAHFRTMQIVSGIVLAGLLAASCTSQQTRTAPEQVEASNPRVTYKYRNDDELVQANQRAVIYCQGYDFVPTAVDFSTDRDGSGVVVFECLSSTGAEQPRQQQFTPDLSYTYQTDQELLDLSRRAHTHCMNAGAQQAYANTTSNMDGSRSVTFRCSP